MGPTHVVHWAAAAESIRHWVLPNLVLFPPFRLHLVPISLLDQLTHPLTHFLSITSRQHTVTHLFHCPLLEPPTGIGTGTEMSSTVVMTVSATDQPPLLSSPPSSQVSEGPIPYPTLAAVRTLGPVAILLAATLARIRPIRKVLQWMFTDTFPLADVPSDVDPKVAKRKAAGFAPASYLQPAMAFLSSMELLMWTVVLGAEVAGEVNSHTVGLKTILLSTGMVLIWVSWVV